MKNLAPSWTGVCVVCVINLQMRPVWALIKKARLNDDLIPTIIENLEIMSATSNIAVRVACERAIREFQSKISIEHSVTNA